MVERLMIIQADFLEEMWNFPNSSDSGRVEVSGSIINHLVGLASQEFEAFEVYEEFEE